MGKPLFSQTKSGGSDHQGVFHLQKTGMILNDPLRSATMKAVALGTSAIPSVNQRCTIPKLQDLAV